MIISLTKRYIVAFTLGLASLLSVSAAGADPLPAPAGKPILTISGKITTTNKDGTAQFDRPMLEEIGLETIETNTPWYTGPVKFEAFPSTSS